MIASKSRLAFVEAAPHYTGTRVKTVINWTPGSSLKESPVSRPLHNEHTSFIHLTSSIYMQEPAAIVRGEYHGNEVSLISPEISNRRDILLRCLTLHASFEFILG